MKKPELLAPAGDFEKLKFAFAYGADAVYAGLPMFSLRTRENRFDLDFVKKGIDYAHALGRKIYITANIYAHNLKIEPFLEAMEHVVPLGADAYIMSDPGLIDLVREKHPKAVIHLSTQANNTNWAQVRFWKKLGISRIILARELMLSEIREIVEKNPDIEMEAFVHGAMCMSYSGRCLLSDYMTGRPSNSGSCTQSCRWPYKVYVEEPRRPEKFMPVEEDEHGSYIFNSKDLCTIELLPAILQTGISSIKIEGRNKNFLYLATVTRAYRQAIDACLSGDFEEKLPALLDELRSIDYRGYTRGFFEGPLDNKMNYDLSSSATREFGGKVVQLHTDGWVEIDIKNKLSVGDTIEWITPDRGVLKETLTQIRTYEDLEIQTLSAGSNRNPKIHSTHRLDEYCLLRTVIRSKGLTC
ncbi:U32 family peptidase C-terminal domain-containing protein [Bdellovibrionota bacterium FG-2]